MKTILTVFNEYCKDLVIDEAFCKSILNFDIKFVNKNQDHVKFFSSPLLGVYPARWTDEEHAIWMDDILDVDEIGLRQDIHALPTVNKSFNVTSSVINQSFIYIIYRLYNSSLNTKLIDQTVRSVIHLIHYKFITSIMARYFKYPADKSIAEATYNALTRKSDIKVTRSWGALVKLRGENYTARNSIHLNTFKTMRNDAKVLFAISDIQTRIRKLIKTQTALFYQIKDSEGKVVSVSSMMMTEEGHMVKDVRREATYLQRYMGQVVPDKRDFVRVELFNVIMNSNQSASPEVTLAGLGYLSDIYRDRKKEYASEMVESMIVYGLNFMREKSIRTGDLSQTLIKVKSMLVGSRVNDDNILRLRELGDKVINEAHPRSSAIPTSPERTALLLYVLMRALTKDYYSSSTSNLTNKQKAAFRYSVESKDSVDIMLDNAIDAFDEFVA